MCTLIADHDGAGRLWIAANRDEVLVRPASAPRRWPGEQFVAPRDEVGGGTWLGLTARVALSVVPSGQAALGLPNSQLVVLA